MAANLSKDGLTNSDFIKRGDSADLDWLKKEDGKKLAFVGLGWDSEADLDASLLLLGANGMPRSQNDLYFYNHLFDGQTDANKGDKEFQKKSPIVHTGDARASAADDNGDEEVILIDFAKIPADIQKLAVVVSIYGKGVTFGQVTNAYVRVCSCSDENLWLNGEGGTEELRYDLEEEASTANAFLFCEISRNGAGWTFTATGETIGDGSGDNGLVPIAQKYGLS
jgi:tellurium resistance protein TerD